MPLDSAEPTRINHQHVSCSYNNYMFSYLLMYINVHANM